MGVRVLVVASEVPPMVSGVARSVGDLIDGLRARGHRVDVLSAADAGYLQRGDFRLSALGLRLPQLRRRLGDYDVVNVHGPAPSITEVLLAGTVRWRRRGGPGVVYTHHFTMEMPQRWLAPIVGCFNRVLLRLARRADAVVVTSQSYAQLLDVAGVDGAVVIPWGVDRTRWRTVGPGDADVAGDVARDASGELRVLYVGQLRPYKGADVAVEAASRVAGVHLKVIGSGPMADSLARRVSELEGERVELLGFCSDEVLDEWYRWADVVVLPSTSRLEAFGIVLLEGMAAGCIPVASDLPGVRDLVAGCGLLAAPGDPDDLAWALAELARRPELVTELRARSRRRAAEFTAERTVDAYEQLFARLGYDSS